VAKRKAFPDELATLQALYYGIGRIAPMTGDFVAAAHALQAIDEFDLDKLAAIELRRGFGRDRCTDSLCIR
jgi:hypothetical protein